MVDLMKQIKKSNRSSGKNLILVENEDHVKDCLKKYKSLKGRFNIIALAPFAIYELDKHNVSYSLLEDYYKPDELYQFGISNYKKVEGICSFIDDLIQKKIPVFKNSAITPAFFNPSPIQL